MKLRYELLFVSILVVLLGMGSASAIDADSSIALDDDYIVDSMESPSAEVLSVDSVSASSSSDAELEILNVEDDASSSSEPIENEVASDSESKDSERNVLKDSSNPSANMTYHVSSDNYTCYFDDDGILKEEFAGSVLVFEGIFEDKGVFTIDKNNTKAVGNNSNFINTVFSLTASGVVLANFNFTLNQAFPSNHDAGIYIAWDNITVFNNTINYLVPEDTTGIGIYANDNFGLNLVNNTVNYFGQAFHDGFNYGILMTYCYDAFVSGNRINVTLPLREVDWSHLIYAGVSMDKVSAFAAGDCDNLLFANNSVYSTVNGGVYADNRYPTLSSVLIHSCDNSTLDGNSIVVEDYFTRKSQANYLYALDMYTLDDVRVVNNYIDVFTYGGHDYLGTAYPIQVTGPAYNIKVAYNYLHSVSNGPNIGVYSQNAYGQTQIDIISNFINITGKAGSHMWALVAGIEVQDSDDRILNNTIIVDTVGGYRPGDRIYGISYSQGTDGNHKYDIRYNNVSVPGPIAISLNQGTASTTSDTNVMYNILVTGIGEGGDRAVSIGGNGQNNVIRYNTNGADTIRHMTDRDLPSWISDYRSRGTGSGRGIDLSWMRSGSGVSGFGNGSGSGSGLRFDGSVNGTNSHFSRSNATHGDLNSTYYTYGDSGLSIAAASSSAGSASDSHSSVDKRAYEIEDGDNPVVKSADYFQLGIVILAVLLLLLVGYKRQKDKEEEE